MSCTRRASILVRRRDRKIPCSQNALVQHLVEASDSMGGQLLHGFIVTS
jgi:hypothetical protein